MKDFNRRKGMWTLMFAMGIVIGGFIANQFLSATAVEFLPQSFVSVGDGIKLFVGN